ncbi:hypothetical protein EAG18_02220 [Pseudoalteromonas sp. J010]|uniref:hypothetical protein n=1 Tax=unclassified Pseudoalteromonas TaxID=194690 RepID=UPI000F64CD10|nr:MULTISPECIES: hypothetical protein [unclassified Pseudoalteromonas]RRS10395.1 hypothetical protein EAG18_02220 [Pseudoalteromonas sp. J010]USD28444.1 hypothetical protein J8Z24_16280 [Pseudoalteromonas sp. SCSIO 43201]
MKSALIALLLLSSFYANAGSALIPEWRQHNYVHTCINISNISSSDVGVTVKLYKQDGSLYTGSITGEGAVNTEFTLSAQNTIQMCVPASASNFMGFGSITGRAIDSSVTDGFLVARAVISDVVSKNKWQSVTINGGKAF